MISRLLRNQFTYALLSILLMATGVYLAAEHAISLEWSLVFVLWSVTAMLFACTLAACSNPNPTITQTHVSWLYGFTLLFMVLSVVVTMLQTIWSVHAAMQVA